MIVREFLARFGLSVDEAKFNKLEQRLDSVQGVANKVASYMAGLGATLLAGAGVAAIAKIADEWSSVEARVGLVTKSAAEQEEVLKRIYDISNDTRQSYTATADLYSKVARSADSMGKSQQEVLDFTETVNKALTIGGGSQSSTEAAILQLGQALSAGKVQGDELGSIIEQAPRLAQAIAKGMGVQVGALKKMGADGELTSEKVFAAIMSQRDVLTNEFGRMPTTIGQALTLAGNKFGKFISKIGKATGIFKNAAFAIITVASWIETGIDRAADAVGGFGNLIKIVGLVLASLGAGLVALKWGAIVQGIVAVRTAALTLLANPVFLAWAAGIAFVILLIDDLYTWIQGGDSIIGDFAGSWDNYRDRVMAVWAVIQAAGRWCFEQLTLYFQLFKQIFTGNFQGAASTALVIYQRLGSAIIAVFSAVGNLILTLLVMAFTWFGQQAKAILTGFAAWVVQSIISIIAAVIQAGQMFVTGWNTAINAVMQFFSNLGSWAIGVIQNIGNQIGEFILSKLGAAGQMLAKLTGIDLSATVSTASAASAGQGGGTVNNDVNVQVTVPPGTPAEQASFLQDSAQISYEEGWGDKLARCLEYSATS